MDPRNRSNSDERWRDGRDGRRRKNSDVDSTELQPLARVLYSPSNRVGFTPPLTINKSDKGFWSTMKTVFWGSSEGHESELNVSLASALDVQNHHVLSSSASVSTITSIFDRYDAGEMAKKFEIDVPMLVLLFQSFVSTHRSPQDDAPFILYFALKLKEYLNMNEPRQNHFGFFEGIPDCVAFITKNNNDIILARLRACNEKFIGKLMEVIDNHILRMIPDYSASQAIRPDVDVPLYLLRRYCGLAHPILQKQMKIFSIYVRKCAQNACLDRFFLACQSHLLRWPLFDAGVHIDLTLKTLKDRFDFNMVKNFKTIICSFAIGSTLTSQQAVVIMDHVSSLILHDFLPWMTNLEIFSSLTIHDPSTPINIVFEPFVKHVIDSDYLSRQVLESKNTFVDYFVERLLKFYFRTLSLYQASNLSQILNLKSIKLDALLGLIEGRNCWPANDIDNLVDLLERVDFDSVPVSPDGLRIVLKPLESAWYAF